MLRLLVERVRFPNRCASCGAEGPERAAILRLHEGAIFWDLVFESTRRVYVPACRACWRRIGARLWLRRLLIPAILLAACWVCAVQVFRHGREWLVAPGVIAALAAYFLARLLPFGEGSVHRRLGGVWSEGFDPSTRVVALGFRDADFESDTALLAGLGAIEREPPAAFEPRKEPSPALIVLAALLVGSFLLLIAPENLREVRSLSWDPLPSANEVESAIGSLLMLAITPAAVLAGPAFFFLWLFRGRRDRAVPKR